MSLILNMNEMGQLLFVTSEFQKYSKLCLNAVLFTSGAVLNFKKNFKHDGKENKFA